MRVEMLMAKMTARGLVISGGGFGGRVELSWTDVAGSLAGLDRVPTELLRTMYLGDHRGDDVVLAALSDFIIATAGENQIKVTTEIVAGLARLAMFEVVNPPHCSTCRGLGQTSVAGIIRVCGQCAGYGYGTRGVRDQAAIAGMKKSTFNSKYSWLAARAYVQCAGWLNEGVRHLTRRMADAA